MRNYGRVIQNMIAHIMTVQDVEEQKYMLSYVATCMRQKNLLWNRDQETTIERIREDIVRISNGFFTTESLKEIDFDPLQHGENTNPQGRTNNNNRADNNGRNRKGGSNTHNER